MRAKAIHEHKTAIFKKIKAIHVKSKMTLNNIINTKIRINVYKVRKRIDKTT